MYVLLNTANLEVPGISENVHTLSETNFSTILKLTLEDGVSYNVSVVPFAELVRIRNDTWQLIGNYNTSYNVSIIAELCDDIMYSTLTIDILEYGKLITYHACYH